LNRLFPRRPKVDYILGRSGFFDGLDRMGRGNCRVPVSIDGHPE
jgi:hypothetical protein